MLGRFRLIHVNSVGELRAVAAEWDDLWQRSEVTQPTARAELLALWVEQFAPRSEFHALVVEDRGRWVAALPLVGTRARTLLSAGGVPANAWAPGGGLLLDASVQADAGLDALVTATRRLPWELLWLDEVAFERPSWRAFRQALARARIPNNVYERYPVGYLEIDHDWEAYQNRLSRNHRQGLNKKTRRLAKDGHLHLEVYSRLPPEKIESWLRRGFEVEDRSWKGEAGSSVLRRGMFPFLLRQAERLANWGQLELVFLELQSCPIAFAYGMNSKGVFHPSKIAYDEAYASFSPGQLLFYLLFERLYRDSERRAIDFGGELSDATAKWNVTRYPVGQLVVAPRGMLGRLVQYAHETWWPCFRRLKARLLRGVTSSL